MSGTCPATRVRYRRRLFGFLACLLTLVFACARPAAVAAAPAVPDPGAADDHVPGDLNSDGAARVVVVGDSIMQGAAPQIDEAFRAAGYEVAVDTAVSRSTLTGVDLVRFYTAMGADAVVVMLGANDAGNPETFRARVRSVVDAAQGAPLLMWMTIPEVREYYPAANEILRQEMSARVGGSVLEWSPVAAAEGVTAGDGLHLTPTGIGTMTGFLVLSVVSSISTAQVGADGSAITSGTPGGATSPGSVEQGGAGDGDGSGAGPTGGNDRTGGEPSGGGESSDGEQDRDRDQPMVPRAADSIDSLIGPGRLVTAVVLMAAALACCGLGVALWSLSRTGRHRTQS